MTFIMAGFASGLVIYWTINNILAIFQQMIIMRNMGVPIHLFTKDQDQKKLEQEIKEGPVVHPSIEMAEEKIEDALLGDGSQHGKEISKPTPRKKKKK
jgi:YidC/Oxa1 family membrane protein insertase